jgi:hypothetical protein
MGAVVAVAVAGTGCADQSAAIRVGDDTVSEKDFREEVEALGQSETALQLMLGATLTDVAGELGDDSYTQPFIGYLVQQRVSLMLQEQLAEQNGIEVNDDDRDAVRTQIESEIANAGANIDDLPEAFVDQLIDDVAVGQALQGAQGQSDLQGDYLELAENADVELSSHLGEWNNDAFVASLLGQGQGQGAQGQQLSAVTPPAGPRSAPGGGEGTEGTDSGSPAG